MGERGAVGLEANITACYALMMLEGKEEYERLYSRFQEVLLRFPTNVDRSESLAWEIMRARQLYLESPGQSLELLERLSLDASTDYFTTDRISLHFELNRAKDIEQEMPIDELGFYGQFGVAINFASRGEKSRVQQIAENIIGEYPSFVDAAMNAGCLLDLINRPQVAEELVADNLSGDHRKLGNYFSRVYRRSLLRYYVHRDRSKLLAEAAQSKYRSLWEMHAHFIIGFHMLGQGKNADAKEHFDGAVACKCVSFGEYRWARALSTRLAQGWCITGDPVVVSEPAISEDRR